MDDACRFTEATTVYLYHYDGDHPDVLPVNDAARCPVGGGLPCYRSEIALRGEVKEALDDVHLAVEPAVSLLSFPAVDVGETDVALIERTLVLRNKNASQSQTVQLGLGNRGDFALSVEGPAGQPEEVCYFPFDTNADTCTGDYTIAAGQSLEVTVHFLPQSAGLKLDDIAIFHSDADLGGSPLVLNVEGVARSGASKRYYYMADHLGSVRATVNEDGVVVGASDYYPFGLEQPGRVYQAGTGTRENYTGHELDEETGQVYAGARYYDPVVGRWGAVDPLADIYPSLSPYNYVDNNPLVNYDPDGRSIWTKIAKAAVKVTQTVAREGVGSLKKGATYADAFSGVVSDVQTVLDGNASIGERIVAGASLASELLPVSAGDVKDAAQALGVVGGARNAGQAADAAQTLKPRPGAAGTLTTQDGKVYSGVSGSAHGGQLHPDVQAVYDNVPMNKRSAPYQHGKCAEAQCLSNALNDGADVSGAISDVRSVRGPQSSNHGKPKEACPSCRHVLGQLGLRDANRKNE